MDDFANWINEEISARDWQYADVARRGGISKSMISRVMSGQSKPGLDFCLAIGRAFNVPPESVMRRAGLLPSLPPEVEEEREVIEILRRLPGNVRRTVVAMIRGLLGEPPAPAALTELAEIEDADNILIPELLEEFRQVPDEWKETAIAQMSQFRLAAEQPTARIIGEELETERNAETPQT